MKQYIYISIMATKAMRRRALEQQNRKQQIRRRQQQQQQQVRRQRTQPRQQPQEKEEKKEEEEEKQQPKPQETIQKPETATTTVATTPAASEEDDDDKQPMVSISQLKSKCRKLGLTGYSKKTKNEIVEMLLNHSPEDEEIQQIALLVKNVQVLKKKCKELGIRGYSNKKKNEIVKIIHTKTKYQTELEQKLEALLETYPIDFLSKSLILKCYTRVLKFHKISLQDFVKFVNENSAKIQKVVAYKICKMFDNQCNKNDELSKKNNNTS